MTKRFIRPKINLHLLSLRYIQKHSEHSVGVRSFNNAISSLQRILIWIKSRRIKIVASTTCFVDAAQLRWMKQHVASAIQGMDNADVTRNVATATS